MKYIIKVSKLSLASLGGYLLKNLWIIHGILNIFNLFIDYLKNTNF